MASLLTHRGISYYQSGEDPVVLLLSGMHGNESGIIPVVGDFMQTHAPEIGEFLYIPEVSPSAVKAKTRKNAFDHDINRSFTPASDDPESSAVMEVVSAHHFRYCLDFHEDPDMSDVFYMYDTGLFTDAELVKFRTLFPIGGVKLFTGLDDPDDPTLGFEIQDGYVSMKQDIADHDTGFSSGYMVRHNLVDRYFTLEIPGKCSVPVKKSLTESLFTYFLRHIS